MIVYVAEGQQTQRFPPIANSDLPTVTITSILRILGVPDLSVEPELGVPRCLSPGLDGCFICGERSHCAAVYPRRSQ